MQEPEHTIAELSERTGISWATTYRIVVAFAQGGLLEKDAQSNKYKVGPELYMIGRLYLATTDLVKVAEPVLKEINNLTGEVTVLSILGKDGKIIIVAREESRHPLRLGLSIGYNSPAYAHANGKALLSELTEAELDRLYPDEALEPLTEKTVATKTDLKRELKQIRKTGVAYNREQSFLGSESVAVLIRDAHGQAIAGIAISTPLIRLNNAKREHLATLAKMGGSLISYKLGYYEEGNPVHNIAEMRSWWQTNCGAMPISSAA